MTTPTTGSPTMLPTPRCTRGCGRARNDSLCQEEPYSGTIEIGFLIAYLLGMTYIVILMIWICKNRSLLKKIDFEYLEYLCLGSVFLVMSLVLWPLNQSNEFCFAKPPFIATGVGLIFGAILAKVYKVWYAFVRLPKKGLKQILKEKRSRSKLTKWELRIIVLGVILIEFILLAVFLGVPEFRPYCECCEFGGVSPSNMAQLTQMNVQTHYSECSLSFHSTLVLGIVNVIIVCIGVYFAYRVKREFRKNNDQILGNDRKDVDEFQPILCSLAAVLFLGVVVVSISVGTQVQQENAEIRNIMYAVRASATILSVLIPVSVLFCSRKQAAQDKAKQLARGKKYQSSAANMPTKNSRSSQVREDTQTGSVSMTQSKPVETPNGTSGTDVIRS